MMRAVLCLVGLLSANALVFRGSNELLTLTDMRPDLAAKLLSGVENRWAEEARSLLSGKTMKLEGEVQHDVVKSCTKIANSIVRGSDGDGEKVQEYMKDVCAATSNKEDNALCIKFQNGVQSFMSADTEFDRDQLDMTKFCEKFYAQTIRKVAEERKKLEEEKAAAEKKAAEEKAAAEKKAAEEAAKAKALKEKEASKADAEKAIKEAKQAESDAESAEKVAEELTAANEREELSENKLMDAQSKEAETLKAKARNELAHAAAEEAAEAAKLKAEKAFEEAAEKEAQEKRQAEAAEARKKAEAEKEAKKVKKVEKKVPVEKKVEKKH